MQIVSQQGSFCASGGMEVHGPDGNDLFPLELPVAPPVGDTVYAFLGSYLITARIKGRCRNGYAEVLVELKDNGAGLIQLSSDLSGNWVDFDEVIVDVSSCDSPGEWSLKGQSVEGDLEVTSLHMTVVSCDLPV